MDVKRLSRELLFDVSCAEEILMEKQFNAILNDASKIENIDTSNVVPSDWPYALKVTLLRDDNDFYTIDKTKAISLAKNDGDFIIVEGSVK